MIVTEVTPGGAFDHDGRISVGDYLLSINNESLRRCTQSQARSILKRTQLVSTDIAYVYSIFSWLIIFSSYFYLVIHFFVKKYFYSLINSIKSAKKKEGKNRNFCRKINKTGVFNELHNRKESVEKYFQAVKHFLKSDYTLTTIFFFSPLCISSLRVTWFLFFPFFLLCCAAWRALSEVF